MDEPVYLDHHSTTPCDPRVVEAMRPYFSEVFGNPSAITHEHGRRAATAVEDSRAAVASFFNVRPTEVFFTAGATESNNTVLFGMLAEGDHLITSAVEHKSILEPVKELEKRGIEITVLPVDADGFVDPESVRDAIRGDTKLVSIIWANGEIGTIEPMADIAAICEERDVPFHSDATQAVGKVPVDLDSVPCRLLSLSAHKFYGPKGVGALIARQGQKPKPFILGGGQEKRLRSGTVNVPGVVGLAEALDLRRTEMSAEATKLTELRNRLWNSIVGSIEGSAVNGPRDQRLPGNLSVTFDRIGAEELMMAMRRFSLSSGSACSSGSREPSSVLTAIGLDDAAALGTVRFGLGQSTDESAILTLVEDLKSNVPRLRELSI
ncbi:MAG: cysteine desulfurase family protein [Thermoanaerobaculia bacterium]|nr:cysteine desulfurase family protein [Thermoanaerobaculia bacterium]